MFWILISALFLTANDVYAGLGRPAPVESVPAGVCKITLKKGADEFHCTGSLINKSFIKTAGHCLHRSQVVAVSCDKEKLQVIDQLIFPSFNSREIRRDESSRWFDHGMIEVVPNHSVDPIKTITLPSQFNETLKSLKVCMLSGFGLQENPQDGTGRLKAIHFSPELLEYKNNLIYAKGAFQFELLPGDSGGPLLCHNGKHWLDLGTASAHDWDHHSLYAPNFRAKNWISNYLGNSPTQNPGINNDFEVNGLRFESTIQMAPNGLIKPELYESYTLKPYSKVKIENQFKYNGDITGLKVLVIQVLSKDEVLGEIQVGGVSQFYLCSEQFMCYGETFTAKVKVSDLEI